jgi:Rrf2 family transcriptional regulator, iron-sulfur cluster assembly transcription factor
MILSSTTSYALRILIQMAQDKQNIVSAKTLYDILGIKKQYLRRILTDLAKHGFVKSSRGRLGGFEFARDPDQIYIHEVIDAIEGFTSFEGCLLGVKDCNQSPQCAMHAVWADAREMMLRTFRSTTLSALKKDQLDHL